MSIVHLKTRKQRIALNKKASAVKRIRWSVGGHEIEVLEKPENEINCFETTSHKGVFFDGKEMLRPGRMGPRVGFIQNDVHYQVHSWQFRFTGVKESKNGKFILLVDGWEAVSQKPVNQFFRALYLKVLLQGFLLLGLSMVGVAAVVFSHNRIVSSWVARIFLILLPMGLYYCYVGAVGSVKYHTRMFLDEKQQPPWPPATDGDDDGDGECDDGSGGEAGGEPGQGRRPSRGDGYEDDDDPVLLGDAPIDLGGVQPSATLAGPAPPVGLIN